MTKPPILDTHVWIWWMLGDRRLSSREREILDGLPRDARPVLCDISLWEVALLVKVGRLHLDDDLADCLRIAAAPATVEVRGITPAVVVAMNQLPATFHPDPADRLIVAAARAAGLPVATRDQRIRRSRLVTLWTP